MITRRAFVMGGLALAGNAAAARREPGGARVPDGLWERLRRGGLVLLMRHAATDAGLGDPPGFRLDDCATQRNLSAAGREDARRIGARLREQRVPLGAVLTSPWCRCRETAKLAFGRSEDWEPLSSFFDFPHREREFTERVKQRIATSARRSLPGNVMMVTHNVNIAALTGHSVGTGEIVVVRPEGCCEARAGERFAP